ncbi:MAG: hypothetical protein F6K11_13265 [Leptolyngbya sp. SIO3F4]|nr:hypothetical protein [Leptolyngbya sp. SIO3F4]
MQRQFCSYYASDHSALSRQTLRQHLESNLSSKTVAFSTAYIDQAMLEGNVEETLVQIFGVVRLLMKTLLLATLTALLAIASQGKIAQAQGLFNPTAEGCADILEPTIQTDCQEAYEFRQFYQGEIEDIRTIYQLAELRQAATVWIAPDYGESSTVDPPTRLIVLQQFILADTGEPWIHVRFSPGDYGFIQTSVVE